MPSTLLSGHQFSYTISRKSRRSMSLRMTGNDSFVVSCPILTPQFAINKLISDHSAWIVKNALKFKPEVKLSDLKEISLLGESYRLELSYAPRESLVIFPETKTIYLRAISLSNPHLKKILNLKFRPLALKLIKENLKELAHLHGFDYAKVSVRNQTSRFGSCSSKGNLSFNWQIIFLPKEVFLHILLHELTHLKIKDHSRRFWSQLTEYDPNTKTNNHYLKTSAPHHFLV